MWKVQFVTDIDIATSRLQWIECRDAWRIMRQRAYSFNRLKETQHYIEVRDRAHYTGKKLQLMERQYRKQVLT